MLKQTISMKTMTFIGVFIAMISVLSQISIPMPTGVPITLQTFAIALTGFVLQPKNATLTVLLYILLGLIGIPIFAGFNAGLGALFGKTGGFLIGFLFLAFFCGLVSPKNNRMLNILYCAIGLIFCHFFGILQFAFLMKLSLWQSFLFVSAPFFIKDILSIGIAFSFSKLINTSLKNMVE